MVYKVVINGRDRKRFGKLHARFPQASDGSMARHKVLIKDATSHEVVLTAECTLPNTQEAVSGLYRAFKLAEPARSSAAPSASKSTRKPGSATGPRFNTEPILLPGLTVVGYRNSESGYHDNWVGTNYGWGSYGDTYRAPNEYPDWWYETDEGDDQLLSYCHSTSCAVSVPEYNQRVTLGLEIGTIRTEGICGQAKTRAQDFLDNNQMKLWGGTVRDEKNRILLGDYKPSVITGPETRDPAEIHLSIEDGMTAYTIAHEAIHALGKEHGYTETFPDGVTRVFGDRSSTDTMGNYCG